MTELEKKVASLACWRSPVELAPLKGGLTNLSFVVTHGGERFVARRLPELNTVFVSSSR